MGPTASVQVSEHCVKSAVDRPGVIGYYGGDNCFSLSCVKYELSAASESNCVKLRLLARSDSVLYCVTGSLAKFQRYSANAESLW